MDIDPAHVVKCEFCGTFWLRSRTPKCPRCYGWRGPGVVGGAR